jgi:hypothetical protein
LEKLIKITGQEMIEMGWNLIDNDQPEDRFILEINITPEIRRIRIAPDIDGADWLNDYSFDYEETLQDLHDYDHLPNGIFQCDALFYNDENNYTSQQIPVSDISEILGGTTMLELRVYDSIEDLNAEIIGFSFSYHPEYSEE